ncbi:MAG: LPS export ABC transporter ATP-binding protein [Myxococcota bacterium]
MTLRGIGLGKRYGRTVVLDGVNLDVSPGRIVGLLGRNGAGKTTAFRILAGLARPDSGRVTFDGQDVTRWPLFRRARLGLGYVAQEPSAFRRLSVADNLRAVLHLMPERPKPSTIDEIIDSTLVRFELSSRGTWLADRLSGGERRRLELARAVVLRPRWLLLDEPFAGIDPVGIRDVQQHLIALRAHDIAVLITDHNAQATLPLCDYAYLLQEGHVIAQGQRHELAEDHRARQTYLGPDFRLCSISASEI